MIFALKWVFHIHSQASQIFFLKHTALKLSVQLGIGISHTAVSCVIMYVFIYTYFKYLHLPVYL